MRVNWNCAMSWRKFWNVQKFLQGVTTCHDYIVRCTCVTLDVTHFLNSSELHDSLTDGPFCPKWADCAQNYLNVVTPCPRVPNLVRKLVRVNCVLPDLFRKDWFFGRKNHQNIGFQPTVTLSNSASMSWPVCIHSFCLSSLVQISRPSSVIPLNRTWVFSLQSNKVVMIGASSLALRLLQGAATWRMQRHRRLL